MQPTKNHQWLVKVGAKGCVLLCAVGLAMPLRAQLVSTVQQTLQPSLQPMPSRPDAATRQQPSTGEGPTIAPEDLARMKLAPGSLVNVRVFEESDLDGTYRLDKEGRINMPVVGTVELMALNLPQAETAIGEALARQQILNNPHIVVNIDEYSPGYVLVEGEVASPGRIPVLGTQRLADILAMAGGQTQVAGNIVDVYRADKPGQSAEKYHYARNEREPRALEIEINPGDTVHVERAGIVYVLGAVARPGGYVMQEDGMLDIAQALAIAGGPLPEAKSGDMRILHRLPGGGLQDIPIPYKKLSKGQVVPVQLAAQDIVYVPVSALKSTVMHSSQVVAATSAAAIYTTF